MGGGATVAESQTSRQATAALLWAACRLRPDRDAVRAALDGGADLERATEVAIVQRISPLVWRALEAADVGPFESRLSRQLREDAARCRAQALLVLRRFAELAFTPLIEAGLEPLVVKGAALADRYPAPGLRPMDDVDVLLPPEQHETAIRALTAVGWWVAQGPSRFHYEIGLLHPQLPGLPLELHRALSTWRERSSGLTSMQLWRRRRACVLLGAEAFGLDPEDELVMLVNHAGKPYHHFQRLLWIVDLAVVVEGAAAQSTPIDWDLVEHGASRAGCTTMLAVGLAQAERLGVESPERLRTLRVRGSRRTALEPLVAWDWPIIDRDDGVRQRLRYALVDRPIGRLLLAVGQVTSGRPSSVPANVAMLTGRAVRRWWRLRSAAGENGGDALEP